MEDIRRDSESLFEQVKTALLALASSPGEAEAIGICGSLARGEDFTDRSDIDVFVVVQKKEPGIQTDKLWWRRIKRALEPLGRDVTVLVYTVKGLRAISNWYVLRLAAEGILVLDRGGIGELFKEIRQAAEAAGLTQQRVAGSWVWEASDMEPGEILEVTLT